MGNSEIQYGVIISERAAEMLLEHVRFLAQVSQRSAEKLRIAVLEAAKSLQYFPQRCPWFSEQYVTLNKYHKMVIEKRYLLIFQIRDEIVYIDYVLDCRQEYRWLL